MKIIGTIDTEKFQLIADDIRGNEVILTDKQIEHIIERRGEKFYQQYSCYFEEILLDPDYIFPDDTHENTALVCKRVVSNGKSVNLVLRLAVSHDAPERKHSIITAIIENKKRFEQRLRNNLPIYEKIDIAEPE